MISKEYIIEKINSHYVITSSRSGGKGGQNVNKRQTKAELYLHIDSTLFSDKEKELIKQKLKNQINHEGILRITCDEERHFDRNKEKVIEKTIETILEAIDIDPERIPTTLPQSEKKKRVETKKQHGEIKQSRNKKIPIDHI